MLSVHCGWEWKEGDPLVLETVGHSVNGPRQDIPLNSLHVRMHELPRDREILVYCAVGQRSYYASRALRLNGFNARNISGGFRL